MHKLSHRIVTFCVLLAAMPFVNAQYFASPNAVQWDKPLAVFHAHDLSIGQYAHVINDGAASDGKAVQVTAGTGRDSHMFAGGWAPVKTDAQYEVAFRLRMSMIDINVAKNAQVLYVGTESMANGFHMPAPLRLEAIHRTVKNDPRTESVVQWYFVDAPSLEAVKDYHDYVIKFDHPMPGFIGVRAYWFGRAYATVWMDTMTVRETALPSESEQLHGVVPDGPLHIDHQQPSTLLVTGPYNWTYRIPEVIGGKCAMVSNALIGDGFGADGHKQALPDSASELSKYDVILLSEIRLGDLSAKQKVLLRDYVRAGGGLVILGGIGSYGKGRVHTSPLLMDLLPVQTTGVWDLKKAPGIGMSINADSRFAELNWRADPRVFYYHDALIKPGAKVWASGTATVNGKSVHVPLLVSRPYGKGTVFAFLGSELGDPQPTQTAIWAWQDWGRFLTMTLNAARGVVDTTGNEKPTWQAPVAVTIPPMPAPELRHVPENYTSDTVEIAQVSSQKLVYRPGEWATANITLINGTDQPVTGKVTVSILSNFLDSHEIFSKDVTLRADQISKVPVVWKVDGQESFGHEVQAVFTDAQGTVLDRKGDYYSVGMNNYRLGQYTVWGGGWSWEYGDTMPSVTPLDYWYGIKDIRAQGITTVETFAWAPDDFGNLSPEEDHWFAGQAQSDGLIYRANLHAANDAAHANGLATITYGKNVMSVAGLHVKKDGVEITRQHPEWAQWMVDGEPKWMFDAVRYRMTVDQMREYAQKHNRGFEWLSVAANCGELDAVRYGAEEFVRGAKMFGWDGLRFDDHFTVESCWDGGINFDGDVMDRGGDFEALSARNNQLFIDIVKAHDPNALIGYNYAATYDMRGIRYPEAYAVTAKDGQCIMEEWSSIWPATLGTWGNIADKLKEENTRIMRLGGISGMFNFDTKNPNIEAVQRWTSALYFATQSHYYNTPRTSAVARNARFMLRYGGVLYDANTQFILDGTKYFDVTAEKPCIWKPLIHERQLSATSKQMTLSVLNMDPAANVNTAPMPPAPLEHATVTFTIPEGWTIHKVYLLDPDASKQCIAVPVTVTAGKAQLSLQQIACWNLLVFDLSKN